MNRIRIAALGLIILGAVACKKEKAQDLFSDGSNQSELSVNNTTDGVDETKKEIEAEKEEIIDPATAPVLTLASREHDFGDVESNATVEHYFTFVNTGKSPLIIKDAKGSCGCTVPVVPKTPIAVGQKDSIKVQFRAGAVNGKTSKTVTLTTNTVNKKEIIRINANVIGGKQPGEAGAKGGNLQVQPQPVSAN